MIKEMVIRELFDPKTNEYVIRAVSIEELEYEYPGCSGLKNDSENRFFMAACQYLEETQDLETDYAKIDVCY